MGSEPGRGRRRSAFAALLALHLAAIAAAALVTADLVLYRRNTLEENGRWRSSKVELERGVIAAVATLTTRQALLGERLNLGAWHGFQELRHERPLDFAELELTTLLPEGSYVALCLDAGDELLGLRLGRRPGFPSQLFRATPEGLFTERRVLADLAPARARVRVERSAEGGLRFLVDGREAGTLAGPVGPLGVRVRGGREPAYVDDVVARDADGALLLLEDFANRRGRGRALALALGLGLLGHGAVLALLAALRGRLRYPPLAYALVLSLVALGGTLAVDRALRRRVPREPLDLIDFGGYPRNIETQDETLARVLPQVAERPAPGARRIVFLGSSQTWGAGAREAEDVWVRVLERALNAGGGPPVECVNLGLCGKRADRMLELAREPVAGWRPDLVVVDLSHNDRDPERFRADLTALVELLEARGTPVLLVLEPITTEREDPIVDANHAVMRAVAAGTEARAFDLQAVLDRRADDGFLWWDHVHLTTLGQRLLAEALLPPVRAELERTVRRED